MHRMGRMVRTPCSEPRQIGGEHFWISEKSGDSLPSSCRIPQKPGMPNEGLKTLGTEEYLRDNVVQSRSSGNTLENITILHAFGKFGTLF